MVALATSLLQQGQLQRCALQYKIGMPLTIIDGTPKLFPPIMQTGMVSLEIRNAIECDA
jgi:hypothetical protein